MLSTIEWRELAAFGGGGAVFFAFGVMMWRSYAHMRVADQKFARAAVQTEARVVSVLKEPSDRAGDPEFWYTPLFCFTDLAGREHTVKSDVRWGAPKWREGERIKIWYNAEEPETARLDDKFSLGGATSGLGFMACAFLLLGAGLLYQLGYIFFIR